MYFIKLIPDKNVFRVIARRNNDVDFMFSIYGMRIVEITLNTYPSQ